MSASRAVVLGLFSALIAATCNSGGADECAAGSDGCPCSAGGECAAGLVCVAGWCQAGPDATGEPPTTATSTATPTEGSASTGETASSGATTSDSGTTTDEATTATDQPTSPSYRWHKIVEAGEARGVELTPAGELAVVGFVERSMYDRDAWLGVHAGDGALLWERTFDGEDGAGDEFEDLAIDAAGNITATGKQDKSVGWDDVLTMTWDAGGGELHVRGYGNEFQRDDAGYGAAVDAEGNVYVCGYFTYMDNFTGNNLAYTTRYADFSGQDWFQYSGLLEDVQYDCETGPSGYLITVGRRGPFASIQRFAPDGDSVYRIEWDDDGADSTVPRGVAIDPADEAVYVAGYSSGQGMGARPWIGRWDFAGDEVWTLATAATGATAEAHDLVIDAGGWLRVVGSDKIDGAWAVVITTLGRDGEELDRVIWNPPEGEVRALGAATRGDSLYVVGGTGADDEVSQILVAEFGI
ncbi:hypothetical protein [Nannocystis radixulma]|uniref:Beta-propeller repeat-containing protein n=1 Tax=Nannocystis radixulma TaxID=2995305 RepID=A0ABT5B187_9BACT|nr:hypothetical protein [Nannocystis radixulma]MDC0667860.1 hypothetical protein [Nannocystis radixulma]